MRFLIKLVVMGLVGQLILAQNPFNSSTDVTEFMEQQVGPLNFSVITGYIPIDWYFPGTNTSIFFELVTKQGEKFSNIGANTPLVVWYNGGPGSDSQYGSWCELGPFQANFDNLSISLRPFSWNKEAMIIFIDQPIGVGFSYSSTGFIVNNTELAAEHMVNFYYNFFKRYANLTQNPFYMFGESFGGHYIPTFAIKLLQNDTFLGNSIFPNGIASVFKGVGIGDGWTYPQRQITTYDEFEYSIGIASTQMQQNILHNEEIGLNSYAADNLEEASLYFEVLTNNSEYFGNISIYNFNSYGQVPDAYDSLLGNRVFANGYGIPQIVTFNGQGLDIYGAFQVDIPQDYSGYVQRLINRGNFNVLLYNGQNDIIVNTAGAVQWINSMKGYVNLPFWQQTSKQIFLVNQTTVGSYKVLHNFCFATIYNAGHMVPTDQPVATLQLFQNALAWDWPSAEVSKNSQRIRNDKYKNQREKDQKAQKKSRQ